MTRREDKLATKKRILSVCVRLFIEQGYSQTTLSQIVKEAKVSFSSFQNIFHTKEGVLFDLTEFMFDTQFEMARGANKNNINPIYVYAVETAIQMTLTELNENLREIYVGVYSNPVSAEYIHRRTAKELVKIFAQYNPDYTESDYYELEIGSAGIMRSYMWKKCDQYFTLERKLDVFLRMSLRIYNIPEETVESTIAFVHSIDIKDISNKIMYKLFEALAMEFEFELGENKGRFI